MNARAELHILLGLTGARREADQLLDAFRTEVLREAADAIVAKNDRVLWATKPGKHWASDLVRRMADKDGAEQPEPIALPFTHTDGAGAHLTVDQIDIGDEHPAVSITATLMPEQVTVVVLADEVADVIAALTAASGGAS